MIMIQPRSNKRLNFSGLPQTIAGKFNRPDLRRLIGPVAASATGVNLTANGRFIGCSAQNTFFNNLASLNLQAGELAAVCSLLSGSDAVKTKSGFYCQLLKNRETRHQAFYSQLGIDEKATLRELPLFQQPDTRSGPGGSKDLELALKLYMVKHDLSSGQSVAEVFEHMRSQSLVDQREIAELTAAYDLLSDINDFLDPEAASQPGESLSAPPQNAAAGIFTHEKQLDYCRQKGPGNAAVEEDLAHNQAALFQQVSRAMEAITYFCRYLEADLLTDKTGREQSAPAAMDILRSTLVTNSGDLLPLTQVLTKQLVFDRSGNLFMTRGRLQLHLEPRDYTTLLENPELLFELLAISAISNLPLPENLISFLRKAAHQILSVDEFRTLSRNREIFREMLREPESFFRFVKLLLETRLIDLYFPALAGLRNLPQDHSHLYTAEAHSLLALKFGLAIYQGRVDRLYKIFLEKAGQTDLFLLALLFHDIGKSDGANGHEQRSSDRLAAELAPLELSDEELRTVQELVANHSLLSFGADKDKDLVREAEQSSESHDYFISRFRARVKKISSPEQLKRLYLLHVCDWLACLGSGEKQNAVAIKLEDLSLYFEWCSAVLENRTNKHLMDRIKKQFEARIKAREEQAVSTEEKQALTALREFGLAMLKSLPAMYLYQQHPDHIFAHIELAYGEIKQKRRPYGHILTKCPDLDNALALTVITRDTPRAFSTLAHALAAFGLDISRAGISRQLPKRNGSALTIATVTAAPADQAPLDLNALQAKIERVLAEQFGKRRKKSGTLRPKSPLKPTSQARSTLPPQSQIDINIMIDEHSHADANIIRVRCPNVSGVLATIAQGIEEKATLAHVEAGSDPKDQACIDDEFLITDQYGRKIEDQRLLEKLKWDIYGKLHDFFS